MMLRNYLTTGLRNFQRHPIYSVINISGLALGLTSAILIFLWVMDELSYDLYHQDNNRVFKLMENSRNGDGIIETEQYTSYDLAEKLKSEFPEVEQTCRLASLNVQLFRFGEKANYEKGRYGDPSIFEVLNLQLAEGLRHHVLPDNNSIAVSKKMARSYFDGNSALGKTLRLNNTRDVTVTAVFEDIPENSTERFDFVIPFEIYIQQEGGYTTTLVKLRRNGKQQHVDEKLIKLESTLKPEAFQPLLFTSSMMEWHLYSTFEDGKQAGGSISYVILFSLVAFVILVIACINFMNLSTARAASRSREVGIRKVAGASRGALVKQFMTESIVLSLVSLVIALFMVHMFLPFFNSFSGKHLTINYMDPIVPSCLLGITLLTGFLAGSYPAFFLSSFRPASVLKGNLQSVFEGANLRKALVVFQFGLSMIIIVSALVLNEQISYLRNKNLGFDKRNILTITTNPGVLKSYEIFRNESLLNPAIKSIALGAANPMEINGYAWFDWDGRDINDETYFDEATCDYDYLTTLGFTLIEGRNFSRDFPSDTANFIVTEEATKLMKYANPIGRSLKLDGHEGKIIGVIKDFHNLGIEEKWNPTVFRLGKNNNDFGGWAEIFVRYDPGKLNEALDYIQLVYKKHNSDYPIKFDFLDQSFERQFRVQKLAATLSNSFTVLAIIISGLGLFGLALFSTEKRVKEIGIRKVLGASVNGLVILLCKNFVRLVFYAILLGSPVAYYIMQQFLERFAYHTQITFSMFMIPALIMFFISLSIISYQAIKAALGNVVEALRSE